MVLTHVLTVSKGYSYTLPLPHFWCMAGFLLGTLFAHGLHKFTTLAFVNKRVCMFSCLGAMPWAIMDTALAGFVRVAFDNHIIPQ